MKYRDTRQWHIRREGEVKLWGQIYTLYRWEAGRWLHCKLRP